LLLKECGCPLSQPGSCRFQSLILIFFCLQGFDGIIAGTCSNNWAEYLVQLFGPNGAVAILSLLWVDSTCATASCFMSAQRVCLSSESFYPDFNVSRTMEHNSFPQLQCLTSSETSAISEIVSLPDHSHAENLRSLGHLRNLYRRHPPRTQILPTHQQEKSYAHPRRFPRARNE